MMISINILKRRVISVFLILTWNCEACNHINDYSYIYYIEGGKTNTYIVKQISKLDDDIRRETNFIIKGDSISSKSSEIYRIDRYGVDKVRKKENNYMMKPYLTIINNQCVTYEYEGEQEGANDFAMTQICFLGKEDIVVQGKKYDNVYKFKKVLGRYHSVETIIYYDENFIPIKEEWIGAGDAPYFRIERLSKPIILKVK